MDQLNTHLRIVKGENDLRRQHKIQYDTLEYKKKQIVSILESEIQVIRNLERRRILKIRAETKSSLERNKKFYKRQQEREEYVRNEANELINDLQQKYSIEIQEVTAWQRLLLTQLNSHLYELMNSNNNHQKAIKPPPPKPIEKVKSIAWNGNDTINNSINIEEVGYRIDLSDDHSDDHSDVSEGSEGIEGSSDGSDFDNDEPISTKNIKISSKTNSNNVSSNLSVLDNACDKLLSDIAELNKKGLNNSIQDNEMAKKLQNKFGKIAALLNSINNANNNTNSARTDTNDDNIETPNSGISLVDLETNITSNSETDTNSNWSRMTSSDSRRMSSMSTTSTTSSSSMLSTVSSSTVSSTASTTASTTPLPECIDDDHNHQKDNDNDNENEKKDELDEKEKKRTGRNDR